jgi:hypothetical protein
MDSPSKLDSSPAELSKKTGFYLFVGVLLLGALLFFLLMWFPGVSADAAAASRQLDIVKIVLSVFAGAGGAIALWLAFRRQRSTEADLAQKARTLEHQMEVAARTLDHHAETLLHQQRVAEFAEKDAYERRATEIYAKSIEQLGSSNPSVRLGSVYSLERLGRDNISMRQTIVNVLCAYMRMPIGIDDSLIVKYLKRVDRWPESEDEPAREIIEELQVRRAIQHIIGSHFDSLEKAEYWGLLPLNLDGAVLLELDMGGLELGSVTFRRARFLESATFDGTNFRDEAVFSDAVFYSYVSFEDTVFHDVINDFGQVNFKGVAYFSRAIFKHDVNFTVAKFESKFLAGGSVCEGRLNIYYSVFEDDVDLSTFKSVDPENSVAAKSASRKWPKGWKEIDDDDHPEAYVKVVPV